MNWLSNYKVKHEKYANFFLEILDDRASSCTSDKKRKMGQEGVRNYLKQYIQLEIYKYIQRGLLMVEPIRLRSKEIKKR